MSIMFLTRNSDRNKYEWGRGRGGEGEKECAARTGAWETIRRFARFSPSPPRPLALSLFALFLAAGCSTQQHPTPEPINRAPIVGDPALALRSDWPQSSSHYANGATAAWSTRFPYDLNRQNPTAASVFLEPAM